MPRSGLVWLWLWSLVGPCPAQEEPNALVLPQAAARQPEIDDAQRAELARQLCGAVDAGDRSAVQAALDAGANPNVGMGAGADTTAGRTPLIHAVLARQPELVDLLVSYGARLENGDDAGHTPLMYAALTGNEALCRHLLRLGARPDSTDKQDATAADYADGKAAIRDLLTAAAQAQGELLAALGAGDLATARQAVTAGASPNANDGKNALLRAAVATGEVALVGDLLALGCRVDLLLVDGFTQVTPLGLAAESAPLAVLQRLLDARPGRAALAEALSSAAGCRHADREARVALLLGAGAAPNTASLLHPPALALAAMHGDVGTMRRLLAAGANLDGADLAVLRAAGLEDQELALQLVRALLAIGADPNFEYLFANALGAAAAHGNRPVMTLLLGHANATTLNTAVGEAARAGHAEGLQWLLEHGQPMLDLSFAAGLYAPPLLEAIDKGHVACVRHLLAAHADANLVPGVSHDTPLVTAVKRGRHEIVEMLLEAGANPRQEHGNRLFAKPSALAVARELGDERLLALLSAQARKIDPLAFLLEEAGLSFADAGDRFDLRYGGGPDARGQTVHLRKRLDAYGGLAVHEAYSLCYDALEAPSAEQLRAVFAKRYAIGGLALEAPKDDQPRWRIRFRIDVPADVTSARLAQYLQLLQSIADELERFVSPQGEDRL